MNKKIFLIISFVLIFSFSLVSIAKAEAMGKSGKFNQEKQVDKNINKRSVPYQILTVGDILFDTILLSLLKIELDYNDTDIEIVKDIFYFERERQFIGKQIGQFLIWDKVRGLTDNDIEVKKQLEIKQYDLEEKIFNKLEQLQHKNKLFNWLDNFDKIKYQCILYYKKNKKNKKGNLLFDILADTDIKTILEKNISFLKSKHINTNNSQIKDYAEKILKLKINILLEKLFFLQEITENFSNDLEELKNIKNKLEE